MKHLNTVFYVAGGRRSSRWPMLTETTDFASPEDTLAFIAFGLVFFAVAHIPLTEPGRDDGGDRRRAASRSASEVAGLQIYAYLNSNPTPPSLDIYPGAPFQTGAGFGVGQSQVWFTIRARVSTADQEAGMKLLLRLMDPNDPASVEAAIADTVTVDPGGRLRVPRIPRGLVDQRPPARLRMEGERHSYDQDDLHRDRLDAVRRPPAGRDVRGRARPGARGAGASSAARSIEGHVKQKKEEAK